MINMKKVDEKEIEEALDEIIKINGVLSGFEVIAKCKTRGIMKFTADTDLCSDKSCNWCSGVRISVQEQLKK